MSTYLLVRRAVPWVALTLALLVPPLLGTYATSAIGLKTLWFGLCAVSLTFLAAYGGMISLAQMGLFGMAGLLTAALQVQHGVDPWIAAGTSIAAVSLIGLLFGALASSSTGVYFLMITLALAMISYLLFSAVPAFGLHEGINGVFPPSVLGDPVLEPNTIYYFLLATSVGAYVLLRHIVRTPFGIAFQGVRDEPPRMAAMGYNPRLYRTLAFAFAAAIAASAGVLAVWTNTRMSAGSVNLGVTIELLSAAVIGGLWRLEGAWIGALVFTILEIYGPGFTDRYESVIGLVFLAIVLASPGGIMGIATWLDARIRDRLAGPSRAVGGSGSDPPATLGMDGQAGGGHR